MPGLGRVDDRTFVVAFASLERPIINPWFMARGFVGAPVLTAAAAVALWAEPAFGLLCWALVEAGHR